MSLISAKFPALHYRDFRLYFLGQIVSVIGSWIQTVAISWIIYQQTQSSLLLGLTAFLSQGPQLLLTPLAGVWIDRFDRRRLFIVIQVAQAGIAALLAGLSGAGQLSAGWLLLASALIGLLNAFDTPLRQSSLYYLIGTPRHLASAISLNASVFTLGRFIGPLIGGALLGAFSNTICFTLNALSYSGLIYAMRVIEAELPKQVKSAGETLLMLKEGMRHAWQTTSIRNAFGLLAVVNFCGASGLVLAPMLASRFPNGSSETLGWLLGTAGAGALLGALTLSAGNHLGGFAVLLRAAPWISLPGLPLIAFSTQIAWSLLGMLLIGFGIALTNVATNGLIQSRVSHEMRSRVISLFAAIRFGMDALGGLVAGSLASLLGPEPAIGVLASLGGMCLIRIQRQMAANALAHGAPGE